MRVKIVRNDMSFIMPHNSCMKMELNALVLKVAYNSSEIAIELGAKIIVNTSTASLRELIN